MSRTKPLDGELLRIRDEIHGYALEFGLDFYEVRFEVCDYDTINILAAQGGFPQKAMHTVCKRSMRWLLTRTLVMPTF